MEIPFRRVFNTVDVVVNFNLTEGLLPYDAGTLTCGNEK